ncbi:MAG: DPP IV N-terminal domain-containing protein, partial [Planctomycetota bacterium]
MSRIRMSKGQLAFAVLLCGFPGAVGAQGTLEDYIRADSFAVRTRDLVVDVAEEPNWIGDSSRFWYRKSVEGGDRFVLVDPTVAEKRPAFDHARLAESLTAARGDTVTAVTLPFQSFEYVDDETAIQFVLADSTWRCGLDDYACENRGARQVRGRRDRGFPWTAGPGQRWRMQNGEPVESPDSALEAFIHNYNVAVREVESNDFRLLTHDGSEGNQYTRASLTWSPDSRRLAAYRVIPGYEREVHYVASSPEDQLQPEHSTLLYAKPGDVLDKETPVVLDVETGEKIVPSNELFPNAYSLSSLEWREDGEHVTFAYNQRGHEVFRIIEIDASTGATRAVVSEEPETFFDYAGKRFRHDIDDGEEIIWM